MPQVTAHHLAADYLIIGAGIVGLCIARELSVKKPHADILIIDKEPSSVEHGSGRNSGVIHAGFYYPAGSLKAKLTAQGNQELTAYCHANQININACGKLVVAQTEADIAGIYELAKRAKHNGVEVSLVDEQQMFDIEPNAKTCQVALYSPHTASASPVDVTNHIANELIKSKVNILYQSGFKKRLSKNTVLTLDNRVIEATTIINCAGLYADKIAKQYGFSTNHVIIPFKGIYLKYTGQDKPIQTNIYPLPNLKNPFLGVHYTVTVDNHIKIGPTAIPALWRENYQGLDNFKWRELLEVLSYESRLFIGNQFNFRSLALEEVKKYNRQYFTNMAAKMLKHIDTTKFTEWTKPGIRAQLLNTDTMALAQDFIIEGDQDSIHILNAVSPAWTSSMPFARYVIENYIK